VFLATKALFDQKMALVGTYGLVGETFSGLNKTEVKNVENFLFIWTKLFHPTQGHVSLLHHRFQCNFLLGY